MADVFSKEKRSEVMSKIKSTDTKFEVEVRKWLFAKGLRFRKNVGDLPGKPDIVLPKYRTAIFIHGCFWHKHENCKYAYIPKTRTEFWVTKIAGNVERDSRNIQSLRDSGWKVIVLWECELKKNFDLQMELLYKSILS